MPDACVLHRLQHRYEAVDVLAVVVQGDVDGLAGRLLGGQVHHPVDVEVGGDLKVAQQGKMDTHKIGVTGKLRYEEKRLAGGRDSLVELRCISAIAPSSSP